MIIRWLILCLVGSSIFATDFGIDGCGKIAILNPGGPVCKPTLQVCNIQRAIDVMLFKATLLGQNIWIVAHDCLGEIYESGTPCFNAEDPCFLLARDQAIYNPQAYRCKEFILLAPNKNRIGSGFFIGPIDTGFIDPTRELQTLVDLCR